MKACAAVLTEMPTLNGHVMMGDFYKSKVPGVDVSYSLDLTDRESILLKISDADVKSVDAMSAEIIQLSKKTREDVKRPPRSTLKSKLLDMLTPSISEGVDRFLTDLGQLYGINLPALGIEAFPAGVCAVVTSPSMEGDADVEVSLVPSSSTDSYAPPIVVTIGSVRVLPTIDGERKVTGTPVLNYSISFDNRAASVVECRKFCAKLQKYLRSPATLEAKPAPAAPEGPVRRKSYLK
jgi:pyruvate/2-oxoglutarate dehydrogenase complex dihydrolipoamide acyltransferase (E2) component